MGGCFVMISTWLVFQGRYRINMMQIMAAMAPIDNVPEVVVRVCKLVIFLVFLMCSSFNDSKDGKSI